MSEIAPKNVGRALVSGHQFCITIGILLANCAVYAPRTVSTRALTAFRSPSSSLGSYQGLVFSSFQNSHVTLSRKGSSNLQLKALPMFMDNPYIQNISRTSLAESLPTTSMSYPSSLKAPTSLPGPTASRMHLTVAAAIFPEVSRELDSRGCSSLLVLSSSSTMELFSSPSWARSPTYS